MTISVSLGGKTYGGYDEVDGCISVDYKEHGYSNLSYCACWDEGEEIDFEGNPDFLKKLKEILLGKACPVNLGDIVLKGETIATLHIKKIVDDWESISFERTPWENEIKALKHDYSRKIIKEKIKKGELGVDVEFWFSNWHQRSGHMSISAPVARWLGEQLILASQGDLQLKGSTINVENDSIAVDRKSPKKKKKRK